MVIHLNRRDLSAMYLVWELCFDQFSDVLGDMSGINQQRRAYEGHVQVLNTYYPWLLTKLPSLKYLWRRQPDGTITGKINEFFAEHDNFETHFEHDNQIGRVLRKLRRTGLFMPSSDERLLEKHLLVPTIPCEKICRKLYDEFSGPTLWPDYLPYDTDTKEALWNEAEMVAR